MADTIAKLWRKDEVAYCACYSCGGELKLCEVKISSASPDDAAKCVKVDRRVEPLGFDLLAKPRDLHETPRDALESLRERLFDESRDLATRLSDTESGIIEVNARIAESQ